MDINSFEKLMGEINKGNLVEIKSNITQKQFNEIASSLTNRLNDKAVLTWEVISDYMEALKERVL